jgi:translation initiation factor 2 beta subunit (eIF-2beta)/eIF-5
MLRFSFKIPLPSVVRQGSRKTVIDNFTEIVAGISKLREHKCNQTCNCIPLSEHLVLFFSANLSTDCNLAPAGGCSQRLIIRGKYWPKGIESLLCNYAKEYMESPCLIGTFDTRLERLAENAQGALGF